MPSRGDRPGRSSSHRARWVLAALIGLSTVLGLAAPDVSAAQPLRCEAALDGSTLRGRGPSDPIVVDPNRPVQVVAVVSEPVSAVTILLRFGALSVPVWSGSVGSDLIWEGTIDVRDYARFGSGLYEVVADADGCQIGGWVQVAGPGPFGSIVGWAGLGLLALGLLALGRSLASALRGKGRPVRSVLAGAAIGLGALVVAQQSGRAGITTEAFASWITLPGIGGGLLNGLASAAANRTAPAPRPGPTGHPPPPAPRSSGGIRVPFPRAEPRYDQPRYDRYEPRSQPPGPQTGGSQAAQPESSPPIIGSSPGVATPPPSPATVGSSPSVGARPSPDATPGRGAATGSVVTPKSAPPDQYDTASEYDSRFDDWLKGRYTSTETAGAATQSSAAPDVAESAPPEVTATATMASEADPPRSSYARLECPEAVVAEQEFELVVGLSPTPNAGVVAEPLRRPPSSVGPYTMTIQVIADALSLARPAETWRQDLLVTADEPYPAVTLHLRGTWQAEPVKATSIRAMFSIDGQPIGLAVRPVAIVREAALLAAAPREPVSPGVDLSVPSGRVAPDLTIRIERAESETSGRLLIQLLAADPAVVLPDAPLAVDIGGDPERFLRQVIDAMTAAEGQPGVQETLMGIGLTVADQLPDRFWNVLRDVAGRLDRPPLILILSAEPYVPWELAVVDPPIDPSSPPFLSAQANVGRWVLGHRRPSLPPPASVDVGRMAVVSGIYDQPGWARLLEAEGEATDLTGLYSATSVDASTRLVLDLLAGRPPADLIHFAVHGQYDPDGSEHGLILVDGLALDPLKVRGVRPLGTPFVFLNACQVGSGQQVLGDYAGIAEAFLFAGASGVVAPLWSIDDKLARSLALRFYERAFAGGSPADVLRRERATFGQDPDATSATYLAYQFFGHPALRLVRAS